MLVDRYGQMIRYAHSAQQTMNKGQIYPVRPLDIEKLITARDSQTLRSLSGRLFTNMGVPRCAVGQIADFSIGEAWLPSYRVQSDADAGKRVAGFMRDVWFPNCDVRGGFYDWQTLLWLTIIELYRDGDCFWALIKGDDGFPRIQIIRAHRIGNGGNGGGYSNEIQSGKWQGLKIHDGIITWPSGRVAAYRHLLGDGMDDFEDIDAANMIHIMSPDYADQYRGLPAFTHAIDDFLSMLSSNTDERIRMQIVSRMYLTVFNETGGPDLDDPRSIMQPGVDSNNPLQPRDVTATEISGGITYFQAGGGEKIEQTKHENPGDIYNNFNDRMIRSSLVGIKWPMALVWQAAGQGTAERTEIMKARRTVVACQKRIRYAARRAFGWAYSVFADPSTSPKDSRWAQALPVLNYPFSWDFTTPPRITVDDGRESKAMLDEWRAGARNLCDIIETQTVAEFYAARADEIAIRKVIARQKAEEASKSSGFDITIDDREMAMLTPNEVSPSATMDAEETTTEKPTTQDE